MVRVAHLYTAKMDKSATVDDHVIQVAEHRVQSYVLRAP
jgi:hypothetical protein